MLPKDGILVINYDDINCMNVLEEVKKDLEKKNVKIYTFSLSEPQADVYAKNISCNIKGFYSFDIVYNNEIKIMINIFCKSKIRKNSRRKTG